MAINLENIAFMQKIKFDMFKSQDSEIGLFDVVFEVEGKTLFAHKTMLNLISTTFASMLADRWTKNEESIKIADYSYDNFYQFLTFLYSGQCELNDENIYSMVDIAEFYGVPLFKDYCDQYLADMDVTAENIFQLLELAQKYSLIQLQNTVHEYITFNFQSFAGSDGFLGTEKVVIEAIITSVKDKVKPEDIFLAVYQWAEKQAEDKKLADPNVNLTDQIKAEISVFLPYIHFKKMKHKFLLEFVVPRGYIFSSYNELSKILCDRILHPSVKVTNALGQSLHGKLKCDNVFIEAIKALKSSSSMNGNQKMNLWKVELQQPSTPSPLKKRDGVEWYLVYYPGQQNQYIGYTHFSVNYENEYVLAELTAETSDIKATAGSKIEIE